MGNAKSRAAKREVKQQEEANVAAAGSSAAPAPIAPGSKQPLTDVERTAVGVSWLRWQASKAISTKGAPRAAGSEHLAPTQHTSLVCTLVHARRRAGHTPPSADGEAQPLYDGSFDEKLCEDLTEVDAAFLAQRDKNLRFGPHVVAVRRVQVPAWWVATREARQLSGRAQRGKGLRVCVTRRCAQWRWTTR